MPARVYSVLFQQLVDTSGGTTYTVPGGFTAVLRDVDVFDGSATGDNVFQLFGQAGQTIDFWRSPVPTLGPANAGNTHQWRGRQVVNEGDHFTAYADSGLDVTISGYLLALP